MPLVTDDEIAPVGAEEDGSRKGGGQGTEECGGRTVPKA